MKTILTIALILPSLLLAEGREPSSRPPLDSDIENIPQFVVIGFDDNSKANDAANGGGDNAMEWILNYLKDKQNPTQTQPNSKTFDGTPARVSFYSNTRGFQQWDQEDPGLLKAIHIRAYDEGHEIGNHTHGHGSTETMGGSPEIVLNWDLATWEQEVTTCTNLLTSAGIPKSAITGFRNPFLAYSNNTFTTIKAQRLDYDCSIEDGWQPEMDGTNYTWPYTLDKGSAGSDYTDDWGGHTHVDPIPGLWELPNTPIVVPPDEKCAEYGVAEGLRKSIFDRVYKKTEKELNGPFEWDTVGAKITGFDYNAWTKFQLKGFELEAILKYTLDLRLSGNRSPFMFGAHSDYYCRSYYLANSWQLNTTLDEMKSAIEGFIDYALTKEAVRIVPAKNIINWCKDPVGLDNQKVSLTQPMSSESQLISMVRNNGFQSLSIPMGTIKKMVLTDLKGRSYSLPHLDGMNITLPTLSSGVYLVTVEYSESGRFYSQKIML